MLEQENLVTGNHVTYWTDCASVVPLLIHSLQRINFESFKVLVLYILCEGLYMIGYVMDSLLIYNVTKNC